MGKSPGGELSWWGIVLVGSCPSELSKRVFVLVGVFLVSCPGGDLSQWELSWWGIVLVGNCPSGELFWWGFVLVGSCPSGEKA